MKAAPPEEKRGRQPIWADDPADKNSRSNHLSLDVNGTAFDEGHRPVIAVAPDVLDDIEPAEVEQHLSPAELLTAEIRLAAVRRFLRIESRSFAAIAEDLGCTRAALSRVYRQVLKSVGGLRDFDRAARRIGKGAP